MSAMLRAAAGLARLWTRVYTIGLDPATRDDRIALIESDLWEQANDRECGRAAGISIVLRCLAGAPADVRWRFDPVTARRRVAGTREVTTMSSIGLEEPNWRPLLAIAAAAARASTAVLAVAPMPHSLAFAGGILGLLALGGWAVEARSADGDGGGSSYWPLVLTGALAATAGGLLIPSGYGGLIVSLPMAAVLTKAWLGTAAAARLELAEAAAPFVGGDVLAHRAARGDANAQELAPGRPISRRAFLRTGVWVGLGSALAAAGASIADYLWERKPSAFGGLVTAGPADRYPPGSKTHVLEGKFWLVHLTEEQGGPGFLALA